MQSPTVRRALRSSTGGASVSVKVGPLISVRSDESSSPKTRNGSRRSSKRGVRERVRHRGRARRDQRPRLCGRGPVRPAHPRHRAPLHGQVHRPAPAPRSPQRRPGHHPHRPDVRHRHRRRARRRRRRLRQQTVPVWSCSPGSGCGFGDDRVPETTVLRHGDLSLDLRTRRASAEGRTSNSPPASSCWPRCSSVTPARCSPGSNCSVVSGNTTSTPDRTWSTSTSGTCGTRPAAPRSALGR